MKRINMIYLCCLILIMAACEKDTDAMFFAPSVNTGNATDIYRKGATLAGTIEMTGNSTAESYGILFSRMKSMTEYTEYPVTSESTDYQIKVQNLEPGTTYYYCAYAYSGYSMLRGEVKNFTTTENNAPVFESITIESSYTGTSYNGIIATAKIIDDGGSDIILSGFCYREGNSGVATFIDNVVNVTDIENGVFTTVLTNLKSNTEYVISAYSVNTHGMGFSESIVVKTEYAVPTLNTISLIDSTSTSIMISSSVIDNGSSSISEIGFCYSSENQTPNKDTDKCIDLTDQKDNESFSTVIDGLERGTTYYIRAYAVNAQGIGYSDVFNYTPVNNAGIYSMADWRDFCIAKNSGASDLSKWKDADGTINLYTDLDFTEIAVLGDNILSQDPDYSCPRYILYKIDENEILNGNDHVISGFTHEMSDFSVCLIYENSGTVKNLHIDEGQIAGGAFVYDVATFCLENSGTIMDCTSKVIVYSMYGKSAGICANNTGTIQRCINWGDVISGHEYESDYGCAAGIALGGTVIDCQNYGQISGKQASGIGGANVSNSINYGIIGEIYENSNLDYYFGENVSNDAAGISVTGTVNDCTNEGNVTSANRSGGIVAFLDNEDEVNNNTNNGAIIGDGYCGGIIGVILKTSVFYVPGSVNTNGGTVNGISGDETNAIGSDERNGNPSIDGLPTGKWYYNN